MQMGKVVDYVLVSREILKRESGPTLFVVVVVVEACYYAVIRNPICDFLLSSLTAVADGRSKPLRLRAMTTVVLFVDEFRSVLSFCLSMSFALFCRSACR